MIEVNSNIILLIQLEKNLKLSVLVYATTNVSNHRLEHHGLCETFLCRGRRYFPFWEKYMSPPFSSLKDLLRISWPRFSRLTPQSFCTSQLVFIPSPIVIHTHAHTHTHARTHREREETSSWLNETVKSRLIYIYTRYLASSQKPRR